MIVSLSLILYDTGLRLRCQQIVTHCNSLMCSKCVLVAVRLTRLSILAETQMLYYSKRHWGKIRPASVVYMASEIYAIF